MLNMLCSTAYHICNLREPRILYSWCLGAFRYTSREMLHFTCQQNSPSKSNKVQQNANAPTNTIVWDVSTFDECWYCPRLSLQWRHNGHNNVSNHQPHDCLLNRLFRRTSKKTSKLRVTGLCVGNSPGTGEFPAQMASIAENVSIWWRHHDGFTTNCISGVLRHSGSLNGSNGTHSNVARPSSFAYNIFSSLSLTVSFTICYENILSRR